MAEARLQGTAPTLLQYFSTAPTGRVPHVLGTCTVAAPEFSLRPGPTGSIGQDYKTRTEFDEDELKGGSNEIKAEGGRISETLPEPGE